MLPRLRHSDIISRQHVSTSPHCAPLLILLAINFAFWSHVLLGNRVLLPGDFLRGFAPFGADPQAPWNILRWDALGQYYPWRHFAAEQLRIGNIPLWNPHQFSGTPFVANGQSAVFYPLNVPFWIFDVARAFGISAFLHTLFSGIATYFLVLRWGRSRAASLLAAIAWSFCGYLSTWVTLPTLSNTAAWLPLLILLFEFAAHKNDTGNANPRAHLALPLFALALCCTLLAGHAQIFFYCLVALLLRALTLLNRGRSFVVLAVGAAWSLFLGAWQLLPTLELSRLSHRAGQTASLEGWTEIGRRALQSAELPSLFLPQWPMSWGSLNENYGYIGVAVALLAACSIFTLSTEEQRQRVFDSPLCFAFLLTAFGLAYATGTPLSALMYFNLPGMAQFGGVGRALVLWSFGAALLSAFGLDVLRTRRRTQLIPVLSVLIVSGELFAANWNTQPSAPRGAIYPATDVTRFLQANTREGSRILFITPRKTWLPNEALQPQRNHPSGVLPPNGAMVYGLNDISGYDSLALRAYRDFVSPGEVFSGNDPTSSPQLNGNMILLNNAQSKLLDALNVRFIVSSDEQAPSVGREVLRTDNCVIYERRVLNIKRVDGHDFAPGWRDGKYQPQSFRFGAFLSLCALALAIGVYSARRNQATGIMS